MTRTNEMLGVLLAATLSPACGEPTPPGDPATHCQLSTPQRLFAHDFAEDEDLTFALVADLRSFWHDLPGALLFSTSEGAHTAGYCGEELAPRVLDGLWRPHEGLALDCPDGVVLRGSSDATLAPVLEGARCNWLRTPEGILGWTRDPETAKARLPLRLIDLRAPELPVIALGEAPVDPLAAYVGPRDWDLVGAGSDRLKTGHFASPYVMRTEDGTVLHVDRDTWTTTALLADVASLVPSPDGRAFAYRPRLADHSSGDLRVRVVASGEEFTVASAEELEYSGPPAWWSADSRWFASAITLEGQHRDRVLSLESGMTAVTPALSHVQHELPDGALWLTGNEPGGDREYYWVPPGDVTRSLYVHPIAPGAYRRATADGLELIELAEDDPFAEHRPGTLMFVPWDGGAPQVLAQEVYPWYRRTADGRLLNTRGRSSYQPGDPMELLLIDGDRELRIDRDVVPTGELLDSDGGGEGGYFRVVGDLLIYAVRDDEGERSGVWAVNLSRL